LTENAAVLPSLKDAVATGEAVSMVMYLNMLAGGKSQRIALDISECKSKKDITAVISTAILKQFQDILQEVFLISLINPLYIPYISLTYPLYIPHISLICPLCIPYISLIYPL
jgi:hypothetical protein